MTLKTHGVNKIGRVIQQNVEQAAYLESLVSASPHLELLAPLELNIGLLPVRRTWPRRML